MMSMVWVCAKRNPIVHLVELIDDELVQVDPVLNHIACGAGALYDCLRMSEAEINSGKWR